MQLRSLFLVAVFAVPFVGCGSGESSSPSTDELSTYVEENPSELTSDIELEEGDTAGN